MNVGFGEVSRSFRPWKPEQGRVFSGAFSFDSETTPLDPARPEATPDLVLAAVYDGQQGYLLRREHVADFLAAHADVPMVMHHAPFDLAVIHKLAPALDIYERVNRDQVWDTRLLHRLYTLATQGHTASASGESTLEHCVELHLDLTLPKDLTDAAGDPVRTSYEKWLHRPPQEIEPVYLEYLAKDAIATWLLFKQLQELLQRRLTSCGDAFGYVDAESLDKQIKTWGPQTHHVQLKAAIVLEAASAAGLHIDRGHCSALTAELQSDLDAARVELRSYGWMPGPGSGRVLQTILERIQKCHPNQALPRTTSGRFSTSAKELARLDLDEPFLAAYADFARRRKLLEFVEKMSRRVLHPRFDVLKVTGRTSSFGDLNSQNLPRDDRVRECIVPSPGYVFVDADYKGVELATLSQACLLQFGWSSQMAAAINAGQDLHTVVAAQVTGKSPDQVTKEERQRAKAVNFGKPGGMGDEALRRYARDSYGVDLETQQVKELSAAWLELFPEMVSFLAAGQPDAGLAVATMVNLTRKDFNRATNRPSQLDWIPQCDCDQTPDPILGWMLLKSVQTRAPATDAGRPYTPDELEYFWSRLQPAAELFPVGHRSAITGRRPSPELRKAVIQAAAAQDVFTRTGRLRAKASYTESHNTIFQGLAADGAKLALWDLWRAGYRIVNFVHDEVLIEVPEHDDLTQHVRRVENLMVDAMQRVVPDVRIEVELAAATCWSKRAKLCRDASDRIVAWTPGSSAGVSDVTNSPPPLPTAETAVNAAAC